MSPGWSSRSEAPTVAICRAYDHPGPSQALVGFGARRKAKYDRALERTHAQLTAEPRPPAGRSVFDGVPIGGVDLALADLPRHRYLAGSTVIAQGDTSHEFYVVEDGVAEVFVADVDGAEHRVGTVHPGGALGEMSLFTGQPATGTVRAGTDLDLLIISADDFERIAEEFPVVYRNLGAILSERLARTNRLAARHAHTQGRR